MNEQLRLHTLPVATGRRPRSPGSAHRLDARTLEIGRRGVAEARSILAAHRRPEADPTPRVQIAEAA